MRPLIECPMGKYQTNQNKIYQISFGKQVSVPATRQ